MAVLLDELGTLEDKKKQDRRMLFSRSTKTKKKSYKAISVDQKKKSKELRSNSGQPKQKEELSSKSSQPETGGSSNFLVNIF